MKQMHGLNVEQYTAFGAPDTNSFSAASISSGSPQNTQASFWHIGPMLCRFVARLSTVLANTTKEVYMKRAYIQSYITNQLQYPVVVEITKLWLKLDMDTTQEPQDIGQDGAPSWFIPYNSITTGESFHKYFKILSTKRRFLRGGKTMTVKTSKKNWRGPITGNVDGSTAFFMRKNNPITIIRVYGTPMIFPNSPTGFNGVCLSPYYVSLWNKVYYSYYAMDDATPTSGISGFNGIWPRLPDLMPALGVNPLNTRVALDGPTGYIEPIYLGVPNGNNLNSEKVETS